MQDADRGTGPIRSEFADDPDMLELVEIFVSELPSRVESLQASYDTGDASMLTRVAHQLGGASGGYGFPAIGDLARNLESTLRELDAADGLAAVHDQLNELVALCKRVVV